MILRTNNVVNSLTTKTDTLSENFTDVTSELVIRDNVYPVLNINSNVVTVKDNFDELTTKEAYVTDSNGVTAIEEFTTVENIDNIDTKQELDNVYENTNKDITLENFIDIIAGTPSSIRMSKYMTDSGLSFTIRDKAFFISSNRYMVCLDETGTVSVSDLYVALGSGYVYSVCITSDKMVIMSSKSYDSLYTVDIDLAYSNGIKYGDLVRHTIDFTSTNITAFTMSTSMAIVGDMIILKSYNDTNIYGIHKTGLDKLTILDTSGCTLSKDQCVFYNYKNSLYALQRNINRSFIRISKDGIYDPINYGFIPDNTDTQLGIPPLINGKIFLQKFKKYIDLDTGDYLPAPFPEKIPAIPNSTLSIFTKTHYAYLVIYGGMKVYPTEITKPRVAESTTNITFVNNIDDAVSVYPKYDTAFKVNDVPLGDPNVTVNQQYNKVIFNFTKQNMDPANQIKQSFKIPRTGVKILSFRTNAYKGSI